MKSIFFLGNKNLKYTDYIEKCISVKQCTISFTSHRKFYFKVSSSEETFAITFETKIMDRKLSSGRTFAYALLYKIRLSPLACGIVSVHKRMTYVTKNANFKT